MKLLNKIKNLFSRSVVNEQVKFRVIEYTDNYIIIDVNGCIIKYTNPVIASYVLRYSSCKYFVADIVFDVSDFPFMISKMTNISYCKE